PGSAVELDGPAAEGDASLGNILVVEDSATVREVERHMLEQAGYRVTTAVNGVDGFNKLRGDHFDLIISDIDMPRMNGIEMITKIRANDKYSQIPIIVVSYKDREQDRVVAMDAGANHYVTKASFDSGEMMDRIRELIGVTV
ncbi:MAG: response regulator, partial [Gammaproteobacteria bacterium]|nr:response regulator [Gammaproteobacteria bacterium]